MRRWLAACLPASHTKSVGSAASRRSVDTHAVGPLLAVFCGTSSWLLLQASFGTSTENHTGSSAARTMRMALHEPPCCKSDHNLDIANCMIYIYTYTIYVPIFMCIIYIHICIYINIYICNIPKTMEIPRLSCAAIEFAFFESVSGNPTTTHPPPRNLVPHSTGCICIHTFMVLGFLGLPETNRLYLPCPGDLS